MKLEIKKLSVWREKKQILKDVNLKITDSEIHFLLGPNGSGKSTLVFTIMGIPGYKTKGRILFNGKDIRRLPPERRAKLGLALAFQFPPAIKGVKLEELIKKIKKIDIDPKDKKINDLLQRDVNVDFSGGEKKIAEILQLMSMQPKLAMLDEIDSGLDLKKVKFIGGLLKKFNKSKGTSLLVITHSGKLMKYLKPKHLHIMLDGTIVCESKNWKKVWRTVSKYGYEKCKVCKRNKLLAARS